MLTPEGSKADVKVTEETKNILLGTSGWSYREWIGPFYTKLDKSMLQAYTRVFRTVEIDSTFYRYPTKGMVMGWMKYSPEAFVYSAKLPKQITHDRKLEPSANIEADLNRFLDLMEPLASNGKLGCILIQLPPKFGYQPGRLEDFFGLLPSHIRFAVEFRDQSWIRAETWTLLQKYRVAYVNVDEPLLPPEIHLTTDFSYFRWHGHGTKPWYDYLYETRELESWAPKVKKVAQETKRVYGYFNNHFHGYAVENCLQILEMLGGLTERQIQAKRRVDTHVKEHKKTLFSTLENFTMPSEANLQDLMRHFVTPERLKRAEDIPDDELVITEQSADSTKAKLKDYSIVIDVSNKILAHDCIDWTRIAPTKKFCKHVAKLLLNLKEDYSIRILTDLLKHEDTWQFKALDRQES